MPLQKNEQILLNIESLTSEGSGVGHYEGQAVFVPDTAPGDRWRVKIVKACKTYAYGLALSAEELSPAHIQPACPVCKPCGGCCYQHLNYAVELSAKRQTVVDAFARIGHLDIPVRKILASPAQSRYRNKAQFPVQQDENGRVITGFYAGRSHRVVPYSDCLLQPEELNHIASAVCNFCTQHHIPAYDETTRSGLLRHIFLRRGYHSGEILLCLVINGSSLPESSTFCKEMTEQFPAIKTILLNINTKNTNVILGEQEIVLYGPGVIRDTLCNVPVILGPHSFYQVNTAGAEQLYHIAADYAALSPHDTVLDLYCGMGTIGLSAANRCRELIGVEIIPEAVKSARENAKRMGVNNARFLCADAGRAAAQLAAEGLHPDVIFLDPPRKGCDQITLDSVVTMAPRRVVMVSCNPATAARDAAYMAKHGYTPLEVTPVDMFARTKHCECVVLLVLRNPVTHISTKEK